MESYDTARYSRGGRSPILLNTNNPRRGGRVEIEGGTMSSDLKAVVDHMWSAMCSPYDVDAEPFPPLECLCSGVDVSNPEEAARGILVNAIGALMERVGRFSPWYTKPASEFGLAMVSHHSRLGARWGLTDGAEEQYRVLLDDLAAAIRTQGAVVEAIQHLAPLTGGTE